MKTGRDKYVFLTKAPVSRVILTMAIPTIISMLITSAYNVADTYFVGRINTQSTAAVGIAFSMMSVVQAVLAGGVVLLAVMAERIFGLPVGPRQWAGLTMTAAGLILLGATAALQTFTSTKRSTST